MDKKILDATAAQYGVAPDVVKEIYLALCKEIAGKVSLDEKYRCPYFVIKPVSKPERTKKMDDGSEKTIDPKRFGKIILK